MSQNFFKIFLGRVFGPPDMFTTLVWWFNTLIGTYAREKVQKMAIFSKFWFYDKNSKNPVVGKIFLPKVAKCHFWPESRRLIMCVTPTWIYLKNRPQTRKNGLFQKVKNLICGKILVFRPVGRKKILWKKTCDSNLQSHIKSFFISQKLMKCGKLALSRFFFQPHGRSQHLTVFF